MDVDRTRARQPPPRVCFRCGQPGHMARGCPLSADVRHLDLVQELIHQVSVDDLEQALALAKDHEALAAQADADADADLEDFPPSSE